MYIYIINQKEVFKKIIVLGTIDKYHFFLIGLLLCIIFFVNSFAKSKVYFEL